MKSCMIFVQALAFAALTLSSAAVAQTPLPQTLEAARAGSVEAQLQAGQAYQYGLGTDRDIDEAVRWYEEAAAQDNPLAMFELGTLVLHGVEKGDSSAEATLAAEASVDWFTKAAKLGFAQAQSTLGLKYAFGNFAPKDPDLGRMWITVAEANGFKTTSVLVKRLDRGLGDAAVAAAVQKAQVCLASGYSDCQ